MSLQGTSGSASSPHSGSMTYSRHLSAMTKSDPGGAATGEPNEPIPANSGSDGCGGPGCAIGGLVLAGLFLAPKGIDFYGK